MTESDLPTIASIVVPAGVLTSTTVAGAREAGASEADIAAALIAQVIAMVPAQATALRAQVVSTDPAKLQEYSIKEAIAADPDSASEAEIALLTAEAQARGLTLEALLSLIAARAASLRTVALNLAVWEATAKVNFAKIDPTSKKALADLDAAIKANAEYASTLLALAAAPAQSPVPKTPSKE